MNTKQNERTNKGADKLEVTQSVEQEVNTPSGVPNLEDMPDALTALEAAQVLRIGKNAVYEAIKNQQLASFRIGRVLRVPKAELRRLLGAN